MKNNSLLMYLFLLTLIVDNCTQENKNITYHPTNENLALNDEEIILIDEYNSETAKDIFGNYDKVLTIGSLNDKEELFSEISDVELYNDKYIFILDHNSYNLSVYNINGKFVGDKNTFNSLSKTIKKPSQIEIYNDKLFILDNFNTIHSFNVSTVDSLQIESHDQYKFDSFINNFCVQEKGLIINSPNLKGDNSNNFFHIFNADNTVNFSFGTPYLAKDPMTQEVLSEGIFTCSKNQNELISTMYILPFINIHHITYSNNDYHDKIVFKIEEYKPRKYREIRKESLKYRWDSSDIIFDKYATLNTFKNLAIIQSKRVKSSYNKKINSVENETISIKTFAIDLKSNAAKYLGEKIPEIVFVNENYLVTKKDVEYPAINIYEIN